MKLKPTVALSILGLSGGLLFAGHAVALDGDVQAGSERNAKLESVLDRNQAQVVSFGQSKEDWFHNVSVSGKVNVDGSWANYTPTNTSIYDSNKTYSDMNIGSANLFLDGDVNCWTRVHVGLAYWQGHNSNNAQAYLGSADTVNVDEAYGVVSNFAVSPVYARIGKQRVAFGTYTPFPIVASFTQLLSEKAQNALTLGFNDASGFNGALYTYNGVNKASDNTKRRLNTGGAQVGYVGSVADVSYDVNAAYDNNMADANYIAKSADFNTNGYTKRVGAVSLHGGAAYRDFFGSADYVTAGSRFDSADVAYNSAGAKPRAMDLVAGYKVASFGMPSKVSLGYAQSWQAVGLGNTTTFDNMPRKRVLGQYDVDLGRTANVALQVRNDRDYKADVGGTGKNATTGIVRATFKFA